MVFFPLELQKSGNSFLNQKMDVLGNQSPEYFWIIGDPNKINKPWLGLFCSSKCPGSLILQAYEIAKLLKETKIPISSGFHSPVEKDIFKVVLRGNQPLLMFPARCLQGMRIASSHRMLLDNGQLIFLSTFSARVKRPTEVIAMERKRILSALSERVLIIHAEPESKLVSLCREVYCWGKSVYTLSNPANDHLVKVGAKMISPNNWEEVYHG